MSGRRNKHKYDRIHNNRRHQLDDGDGGVAEQGPYLTNSKLSVFRSLEDDIDLHEAMKIFTKFGRNVSGSKRGQAGQAPLALSQLALVDIILNSRAFDGVLAKQATDRIYDEVPAIRKPLYVRLGTVGIFGHKKDSFVVAGIALAVEEWKEVNEERTQILDTLESLSSVDEYPFSWLPRRIPHISLGSIDASKKVEFYNSARDDLQAAVPEGLLLKRATLHTPGA